MEPIYTNVDIDFSQYNLNVIPVVQGEIGENRIITFSLYDNGHPYHITDINSVECFLIGTKSDGLYADQKCVIEDSNTVRCAITDQMQVALGDSVYSLVLLNAESKKYIKSFPIKLHIQKTAENISTIVSSNEFRILVDAISASKKLENTANQLFIKGNEMVAEFNLAKLNIEDLIEDTNALCDKVSVQEDARVVAENTRVATENSRATAENLREEAEESRITAENKREQDFTLAMKGFSEFETAAKSAESSRVLAESSRVNAEESRVDAEKARVVAESKRVEEENKRVSQENNRMQTETDRSNAELSRQENETSRMNAEESRVEAETRRSQAEQNRVTTETTRETAERSRVEAEIKRENDCSKAVSDAQDAAQACWDAVEDITSVRVPFEEYTADSLPDLSVILNSISSGTELPLLIQYIKGALLRLSEYTVGIDDGGAYVSQGNQNI